MDISAEEIVRVMFASWGLKNEDFEGFDPDDDVDLDDNDAVDAWLASPISFEDFKHRAITVEPEHSGHPLTYADYEWLVNQVLDVLRPMIQESTNDHE